MASLLLNKEITEIPGLWTQVLDGGILILDHGRWILDSGLWTLESGRWAVDTGL